MSSRLGFGCAPILGRVGKKESLRALSAAYAHGITHFDVARSYGFGEAEALLGEFLADKRSNVTITTKFGIVPPRNSTALSLAKGFARRCLKRLPGGSAMVHAVSKAALSQRNYDVAYARTCLEASLKHLRVEQVDYYLIHEPPKPEELTDELQRFLEDMQAAGKIRKWGLTTDSREILETPVARDAQVVLQEANLNVLDNLTVDTPGDKVRFLSRPYGGGPDSLAASAEQQAVREAVHTLGLDDLNHQEISMFFALSLAGDSGVVIASMFSENHIRENVALAERYVRAADQARHLAPAILRNAHGDEARRHA